MTPQDAESIARQFYGLTAAAAPLPGELDANFKLTTPSGVHFVLKIAHPVRDDALLDFENRMMAHLTGARVPQVIPAPDGREIVTLHGGARARLISWLPGEPLARVPHSPQLLHQLGILLGELDRALADFTHPSMHRDWLWDLTKTGERIRQHPLPPGEGWGEGRGEARFERYAVPHLPYLPAQAIHNDANDYNVLVENGQITGLLDFGDALYNPRICELAICAAYALLGKPDPLAAVAHITTGYHAANPLIADEIAVLWDLIGARLAVSLAVSAHRARSEPGNEYHQISAAPVRTALDRLAAINPDYATMHLRAACGFDPIPGRGALTQWLGQHPEDVVPLLAESVPASESLDQPEIARIRRERIGFNLSLSYDQPLHIVRGRGQYLYDAAGREYLDCVNNVCHVGHSHPRVVAALAGQAARLNTNTRYLHENIALLAERLTATLPEGLSVCYFVNSGSEANDLALRLARAHTGRRGMLVLEGAYHGNVISTVDISPYKFNGPGGGGAPAGVIALPLPCAYRGALRREPDPAAAYAAQAGEAIQLFNQSTNQPINQFAAFISEAMIGTGGQVVFPEGYLAQVYARVRAAGGLCIADEVQHGFGRVGSHFWGFELHGVVPDIVTMGKPFGNGHPLAAVVTRPEIAAAFNNGMEYFNTFAGSPVSCAVGLAVLDVIEDEGLRAHAREVGEFWKAGMLALKERHALIGDVRGAGLFLGMELVRDHETLEPADREAGALVEGLKARGILLSTDGPYHNVIKIKPPMCITREDVERVVEGMEDVLGEISG